MIDCARLLPEDWPQRVADLEPVGAISSYLVYLQSVVRHHGADSIILDDIQELAKVAAGLKEGPAFAGLATLSTRLQNSAGGTWPAEIVVGERAGNVAAQKLPAICDDIAAMRGEWEVLNRLLDHGAQPVRSARDSGAFDWNVQLDGKAIGVEVKSKGAIGLLSHRLAAAVRGLAMTGRGHFMNQYAWTVHGQIGMRSSEFAAFVHCLLNSLDDIRRSLEAVFSGQALRDGEYQSSVGQGLALRESHFSHGSPTFAIECSAARSLLIDVSLNKYPTILRTATDGDGGWLTEPGDDEIQEVVAAFSRLRIARQSAARSQEGLYVVVWPVPWAWEDGITEAWFARLMARIAHAEKVELLATLPILMRAVSSFRLNRAAEEMFPSLRPELASTIVAEGVGGPQVD